MLWSDPNPQIYSTQTSVVKGGKSVAQLLLNQMKNIASGSDHDILRRHNGMAHFSIRFLGLKANFGRLFLPLTHPPSTPILSMPN